MAFTFSVGCDRGVVQAFVVFFKPDRPSVREMLLWSRAIMEAYTAEIQGPLPPLRAEGSRTNPLHELETSLSARLNSR